ncbi:retrovirus-related pol polyprotein from transposon TNT 1-94 [Tanacetum coccineum]|uniref:Retrovirus-related pol polyprotein from transposon TNT 1-94 n=1 Tax=Tanacetum coccineum TaxID=301880 RepID=A0ABQ4YHW9_9ASTR
MNSFWPTRSALSMLKSVERFWISVQELKVKNLLRYKMMMLLSPSSLTLATKGMFYRENVDYPKLIWEDFTFQIDHKKERKSRRKNMPFPRFIKVIIYHFLSQHKSLSNLKFQHYHTIKDDGIVSRLKFVKIREDYQEYDLPIPNMMLNDTIKQSESYQMFLKYSTGQITPKKSRGKGSQRKKTVDTPGADVDVSEESDSEPARKRTASRRVVKKKVTISAADNIIPEPDVALELGQSISLTKAVEEEAARQVHATHSRIVNESEPEPAKKKTSSRSTRGVVIQDTPSAPKTKLATLKPKLKSVQPLTPEEQEAADIMQALKESKKTSRRQPGTGGSSEVIGVSPGVPDESTIVPATSSKGTDDDDEEVDWIDSDKYEEKKDDTDDDKSDEQVNDNEDEEMKNAKVEEFGNGDAEISDAAKADVEKTEEVKDDAKKTELPPTIGTVKDTTDAEINSLLDIKIQSEVPPIQSPFVLIIPVSVISEPAVPTLIPLTPSVAPATTLLTPLSVFTIPPIPHQTTTPIPKPPIITDAPTITTAVHESDTLSTVLQRHTADLIHKYSVKPAPESSKIQKLTIDLEQESKKIYLEIRKIKKEQAKKQKMPKYKIKSTDKAALKKYDLKSALYQTMHENKSFNRNPANHALYHALIEALIEDENAMDKGVVNTVKNHKRQHDDDDDDDDDEDPLAGPNQGKKTKGKRTKESESSKKPSIAKETPKGKALSKGSKTSKSASAKEPVKELIAKVVMDDAFNNAGEYVNNPEGYHYPFNLSKPLPLQGHPGYLTVAVDYLFNNDLEYLKTFDLEKTYTTSITKTKAARYESVGIEDMTTTLWSTIKHAYDKDAEKGIKHWGERRKLWYRSEMNKFSKQNVYSTQTILGVKRVSVKKLHGYGHLEEVVVKRVDRQLYKFKEGDFVDLHMNNIEDMLLLAVQHTLFHLNESDIVDSIVALHRIEGPLGRTKGVKVRKGKMQTKTELTLEQTQQGVSDEVLVSIEGVEELKRNVKIKGEKKETLLTLRQKPGKSKKASLQPKLVPTTHSKLELIHMDLCGPMRVESINDKKYILVIVDDYSRYTWVYFLRTKDEAPDIIMKLIAQNKTPYELLRDIKPNVQYFHVFGLLCYPTNGRKDLGKMNPKADIGIFIGYSESSRGFWIYNRRARKIMETIHVKFDELTTMASEYNCIEPETNHFNVEDSSAESNQTLSKVDLDDLLGLMYEEYFEKRSLEVSSFDEQTSLISNDVADEFIQEDSVDLDGNTLITLFCPLVTEEDESSSTNQDSSNMHEFNQVHPSTHTWTKSHPLEQVIGDLSKLVLTRSRRNTNYEVCLYALTVSATDPKNIKEAMLDHSLIKSMQDELHQFERLNVWELVPRPADRNIIEIKWI